MFSCSIEYSVTWLTSADISVAVCESPCWPVLTWLVGVGAAYSGAEVSDCGRYLMLLLSEGCKDNMVYYVDLQGLPEDGPRGLLSPVCIVDKFEADYEVGVDDGGTSFSRGSSCRAVFSQGPLQ